MAASISTQFPWESSQIGGAEVVSDLVALFETDYGPPVRLFDHWRRFEISQTPSGASCMTTRGILVADAKPTTI